MKKYKVYWSITNLFTDTQAEVVKLQMAWKGIYTSTAISTWASTDSIYGMIVGGAGLLIDVVLGCFYFEKIDGAKQVD